MVPGPTSGSAMSEKGPVSGQGTTNSQFRMSYSKGVVVSGTRAFAMGIDMPRVKAIQQSMYPYNVSARCINKEWFQIPMTDVWDIYCQELSKVHLELGLIIHSFVLMSNHFHLLVTTPKANISQCMQSFMYRTSRRLTRAGNRINQTYSGRHYKCILHQSSFFWNAYKYIYRNPVAAKICERVEDYEFSTLRGVIGSTIQKIPLSEDFIYKDNPEQTLVWLNTEPDSQKNEALRWGFRSAYFKSMKNKNNGRLIIKENEII